MATIGILLVNMPRLLAEIVRTIVAAHDDLRVVADLTGAGEQVTTAIDATGADVVVLSVHRPESALLISQFIRTHPAVRLVVVGGDGQHGYICEPAGELSPAGLLDAIRGAGGRLTEGTAT